VLNPDLDPLVIAFKIWVISISTDESPNMERSAMFKKYAIHGKRLARVYKYIFMHHMIIWRFFFKCWLHTTVALEKCRQAATDPTPTAPQEDGRTKDRF
jgi:hypothetical protein